jgi:ribosomal protein S18 acetylase RimI-like enzyme
VIPALVTIRSARPEDGALIAAMIAEHALHEGAQGSGRPVDYADGLATGAYECLLAERAGAPLGLAMFYPTFSSWSGQRGLFLEDLYVREAARGQAVGRRLLGALARIAAARGASRIDLVVQGRNRATEFYARLGLRELPGWQLWRADGSVLAALADTGGKSRGT